MKSSMIWKACGVAAAAAGLVALCACEWGAGSDATSWSDAFNWVNFSGTYRTSGEKTVKESTVETEGAEITNVPIYHAQGSTIYIADWREVTNYDKGAASSTKSTASSQIAFTGSPFTVIQQGQNLTITDGKTGSVLTGKLTSLRSASGYENTQAVASGAQNGVQTPTTSHGMPKGGDTIIGSFEVSGAAGRMVGTLQGTVYDTDTNGSGDVFGNRTLTATFVGTKRTTQIEATCMANTEISIFRATETN